MRKFFSRGSKSQQPPATSSGSQEQGGHIPQQQIVNNNNPQYSNFPPPGQHTVAGDYGEFLNNQFAGGPPAPGAAQLQQPGVENFGMAIDSEEAGFYLDVVQNILQSPEWTIPIANFIDENCSIFDNEEENKFPYSEKHEAFKDLVESLLQAQLVECGITTDILMEVMEKPSGVRVKRLLMSNIVPVDDFPTFKKMMVKRNIELEQEVLKQFQGMRGSLESGWSDGEAHQQQIEKEDSHLRELVTGMPADNELDAEQEMIRQALEESRKEAEALQSQQDGNEDEELRRAIELSMQEDNRQSSARPEEPPPPYDAQFSNCGFQGNVNQGGQAAFDGPGGHTGGQAAFEQQPGSYTNFDAPPYDTPPIENHNSYSAFGSGVNNASNRGGQAAFQPDFDAQQQQGGAHFPDSSPAGGHMGANWQPPATMPQPSMNNNNNFTQGGHSGFGAPPPAQTSPTGVSSHPPALIHSHMEAAFQKTPDEEGPDENEIKRRAEYMKRQRDLLVAKRKQEREKVAPRISSSSAAGLSNANNSAPSTGHVESDLAQQFRRNSTEWKQQEENKLQIMREESDKQEKKKALMQQLRANLE